MALQVPAPPRLSGAEWENFEEFDEEDTEPSESDGEQCLPEFVGPSNSRTRRPVPGIVEKLITSVVHRGIAASDRAVMPAELGHRNGVGGPLRC